MMSRLLGVAAAAAIAAGMAVAAPVTAAVAAPVAAHAAAQACVASGFLNDGSGQGSAMSLAPKTTPSLGELFQQANDSDAWEMCYHLDGTLQPVSAPGLCAANNGGLVQLRSCNSHPDQTWNIPSVPGSFHVQNSLGGYLCASGGVSSLDTVVQHLSDCSSYHSTWEFIAG